MQRQTHISSNVSQLAMAGLSCLAMVLLGSTVGAETQSRPAVTLAPFVLKSTILEGESTSAYRPWFENRKWTGDLIEYFVAGSGERCTSVAVGSFPPDDSGATCLDGENTVQNWSARGAFPDVDQSGADDFALADYWKAGYRDVLFFSPGSGTTNTKQFIWSNLSAIQRQALDPTTCGGIADGACVLETTDDNPSPILNYIRGERRLETDREGTLRRRFSLLGAIINSRPVYVPAGNGLVVVGSNGGMVHGFNATDGTETFSYVPSQFLPHLQLLTQPRFDTNFRFFADGELRHARISSNDQTQHIVAGGLGSGGKGLFILDVSQPTSPRILRELSGTGGSHIPDGHYNPSLGFIHGRPNIAQLPDGEWYVVTGNGFDSDEGARLILIKLSDLSVSQIPSSEWLGTQDNGLAAPALVDTNGDGRFDHAYAGDLEGNLWRFNLTTRSATRLFTATTDLGDAQPITAEPEIARHPTRIGVMVLFGTGKLLSHTDLADEAQNTVYGVWDRDFETGNFSKNDLYPQVLTQKDDTWADSVRFVRVIENESQVRPDWTKDKGWYVNLPLEGERLLGRPQARAERLQFVSSVLPSYNDPESDNYDFSNWINQLSVATGGSLETPKALYDLDRNRRLDQGDAYPVEEGEGQTRYFPLSLNLGPGFIAQPAFARVGGEVDAVFINGLIILPPPTPDPIQGGGDIDVTTDSPNGPMVNPHHNSHPQQREDYPDFADSKWSNRATVSARGPMNKHLEADRAGGRVDGHHRAYNKVHNVSYVDFFDIEPRTRGGGEDGLEPRLRLDPGTVDSEGNPYYARRELNQPSSDGLGGENPPVAGDQEFIVVLTNADLSQGTELRIGCRTWPSLDYQEMVAGQLKAGIKPSQLEDTHHPGQSLVFTLDGIASEICDDDLPATLRISMTGPVGDVHPTSGQDNLIPTLPGCVNNSHSLDGEELILNGTETPQQSNPHITNMADFNYYQNIDAIGFRWRNGALTMQLLRVTDGEPAYVLQDSGLPTAKVDSSDRIGDGGIYAKSFEATPITQGNRIRDWTMTNLYSGDNGLLFEASLFWNFGDMKEFQAEGRDPVCFGDGQWAAFRKTEWDGLNRSQYVGLTEEFRDEDKDLLDRYIAALALLASGEDDKRALETLAGLFGERVGEWAQGRYGDAFVGDYHRMRMYVDPTAKDLQNWLLEIDRDLFEPPDVEVDLTPASVEDVQQDLLPAAGPNYLPGRRSWIDITTQ